MATRRKKTAASGLAPALTTFLKGTAGRGNWGHPGLATVLKGMGAGEAVWKPAPDAHSIWEELNHIEYWSEDVLERLEGRGGNRKQAWPAGEGGEEEWQRAVRRVGKLHANLLRRIGTMGPAALNKKALKSRYTTDQLILGCVSHVAYHVGQIALTRKLYRQANQSA